MIDFLERLSVLNRARYSDSRQLRVHHSKLVKPLAGAERRKIEVFYLPSYASELNPDEQLSSDLKQRVTTVAPTHTKRALTRTASSV
jgi:transposase